MPGLGPKGLVLVRIHVNGSKAPPICWLPELGNHAVRNNVATANAEHAKMPWLSVLITLHQPMLGCMPEAAPEESGSSIVCLTKTIFSRALIEPTHCLL